LLRIALQRKLRFSKAQLRSLRFKLLEATFYRNFMAVFGMMKLHKICSYSVVVKASAC
jgi:hypothetical protein